MTFVTQKLTCVNAVSAFFICNLYVSSFEKNVRSGNESRWKSLCFYRPTSVTNCDFLDDLMYSRVEAKLLQEMCLCCLKTCWSAADTWKQLSLCLVSHWLSCCVYLWVSLSVEKLNSTAKLLSKHSVVIATMTLSKKWLLWVFQSLTSPWLKSDSF